MPVGVVLALAASSLAVVRPALAASVQPAASPASPAAPFITSVAGEGLGILVDWTPASASEGVTTYRLTATPVVTSSVPPSCKSVVSASTPGTDTTTVLGHVCSGVAYEVTMKAVTASGTSAPSAVSNPIVPLTARAPFVPLVTNVLGRNHSLVISWSPPAYDGGKPLTGYKLTVIGSGSTTSIGVGAATASATITGLKNGATYRVVLSALNAVGSSPASTALGEPMPDGAPSTPSDLSVIPDSAAASISVSWVAPLNDGGLPVTSYRLTRLEEVATANSAGVVSYAKAPGAKLVTTVVSGTSTTVRGLSTKSVFYVFAVAAINSLGSSPATAYSEPVTLRTAVAAGAAVVLPSVLARLGSVNNGTLTWMYPSPSSVPSQVKSLKKGEVLVCGISKLTPDGLLVRVTSVTVKAPATYVVTTTSAPLSSAFSTLTTQAALNPLSPGAGSAIASARAGHLVATSPGVEIEHASVGFSKSVTLSVNESASGSVQASLNGTVSFTPSLEFEASILHGFAHIPDGATMSFSASLRAEVSATLTASASYDQRWHIATIYSSPIDIQVGPMPLVLVPTIPIFLELSANGQVGVTASVNLFYGAKASWTSKHPSVLSLSDLSQSPSDLTPSVSVLVDAHGSVEVEAQPQLLIDDVTGPEVDATLTLAAALSPLAKPPSPWLALTLNLQVKAGWKIDLLVWSGTVQGTLASHTWTLYTAVGTPSVKPPLTVSPAVVSVNPGSSEQFSVAGATGSVRWSLAGAAGDTITSSGLFTAASPGGRAVVVTATDSSGESGSATVLVGAVIGPPQDLRAARGSAGTSAAVSWEPPVLLRGATIASYSVSTSPQTAVTTTAANASSATIGGLDPTTTYLVSVSATTTTGFESPPATVMLIEVGPGNGTSSLTWAKELIDASEGNQASLTSISCPNADFCVAVDGDGNVLTYDGITWSQPVNVDNVNANLGNEILASVSCTSADFCVAVDWYGNALTYNGSTWSQPTSIDPSEGGLTSVSCPTASFCAAVDYSGNALTYDGSTWSEPTSIDAEAEAGLSSVSCTRASFCVAVDGAGNALTYNGSTWSEPTSIDAGPMTYGGFSSVSCTSASSCAAVDLSGNAFIYDGSTWSETTNVDFPSGWTVLRSVSCTSASFCVAVDQDGAAYTYNGSSWSFWYQIDMLHGGLTSTVALSCASVSFCAAVDSGGNVVTYDGSTWSHATNIDPRGGELESISCPTASFCAAVDAFGNALTYDGSSWSKPVSIDANGDGVLKWVSCPSASFCVAADSMGSLLSYDGSTWSTFTSAYSGDSLASVSCASASFCVAVDDAGNVLTYNNGSWSFDKIDPGTQLTSVSCATASFCVAVDDAGNVLTYHGTTWSKPTNIDSSLSAVSCVSATFCLAIDERGNVLTYDGSSWSSPDSIDAENGLSSVSCATMGFCVAVDGSGNVLTYDGISWSQPTEVGGDEEWFVSVSCASVNFCATISGEDAFNGSR